MMLNNLRPAFFFLAAGSLLLWSGCTSQTELSSSTGDSSATNGSVSTDEEQPPVTLEETDRAGLLTWLASQRGKVVVLDMWATWCPPCTKTFPELVALHHRTDRAELVCASLCCDFQGLQEFPKVKARALAFLKKHRANFKNFISTVVSDDLFQQLNIVSIPVVEVYSADGLLAKRFDLSTGEDFSYADVQQVVDRLLGN